MTTGSLRDQTRSLPVSKQNHMVPCCRSCGAPQVVCSHRKSENTRRQRASDTRRIDRISVILLLGAGAGRRAAPRPRPPARSVLGSLFSGSLLGSGGPTVGGFGERLSRLLSTINHLLLITGLLFSIIFTHFIPLSAGLIGRVQRCNLLLH